TFFEGDVVSIEETPQRAQARANPSFAQPQNYLLQGQVRLLGDQRQYLHRVLLQWRSTSSARLRRTALARVRAARVVNAAVLRIARSGCCARRPRCSERPSSIVRPQPSFAPNRNPQKRNRRRRP